MTKSANIKPKNRPGISISTNRFKELHRTLVKLEPERAKEKIAKICELCRWSQRTFYRMVETPENISQVYKITIAEVYCLPAYFIFPELEIVH